MGVVNSKKKEIKAYASKYSTSLMQYSSSTSSSQQQQTNSTISNKKIIETDESLRAKTSIYSTESDRPASITNSTNKNVVNYKASTPEPRPYFSESSVLQNAHQSNSFYLPKDWDLKEYQYNVC